MLVAIIDINGRVAADSAFFTTPPRPRVTCDIDSNILTCESSNPAASQLCRIDGGPPLSCNSPFNLLDLDLSLGSYSLTVNITDAFERSVEFSLDFSITSNLQLICTAVEDEREFAGGIDCSSTGGLGDVMYTCLLDGAPIENCEWQRKFLK